MLYRSDFDATPFCILEQLLKIASCVILEISLRVVIVREDLMQHENGELYLDLIMSYGSSFLSTTVRRSSSAI